MKSGSHLVEIVWGLLSPLPLRNGSRQLIPKVADVMKEAGAASLDQAYLLCPLFCCPKTASGLCSLGVEAMPQGMWTRQSMSISLYSQESETDPHLRTSQKDTSEMWQIWRLVVLVLMIRILCFSFTDNLRESQCCKNVLTFQELVLRVWG